MVRVLKWSTQSRNAGLPVLISPQWLTMLNRLRLIIRYLPTVSCRFWSQRWIPILQLSWGTNPGIYIQRIIFENRNLQIPEAGFEEGYQTYQWYARSVHQNFNDWEQFSTRFKRFENWNARNTLFVSTDYQYHTDAVDRFASILGVDCNSFRSFNFVVEHEGVL